MKYTCTVILTEKFCEDIEAESEDKAYSYMYKKYKKEFNEVQDLQVYKADEFLDLTQTLNT